MQTPDPASPAAIPAVTSSARVALMACCPRCGKGPLFTTALSLAPRDACTACGQSFRFIDSGDGPAVFAIFLLGFLVLGGALIAEFKFGIPIWAHVVLWGLLTPLIALVMLRGLKGWLIAEQYKHKAEEGRLERS